ncbi:MAG: hypothetical protein JSW13_00010 [Candidatus Aerophobus sp.]|nr:MAG: hypothetical protein JSW13_00010 [Candidatus Aerophobus sp.]
MSYLLGVDLGTTGLKCAICDEAGKLLAISRRIYPFVSPQPGWAEHNPNTWWIAAKQAIRETLGKSHIDPNNVKAVSLCGFHHCPVFLDNKGQVLRNTITTHDKRTIESWKTLKEQGVLTLLEKATGSAVGTCHFPPIFHWIRSHDRNSIKHCSHILMPKDFLRFKLTGEIITDICDATGTHLVNPESLNWSEELAKMMRVPLSWLPPIQAPAEYGGQITSLAAKETGLVKGTPVITGGGDTHCALLGMGVLNEGQAGMIVGTSAVIRACFAKFAPDGKIRCYIQHHVVPGIWCNAASIFSGASSLQWGVERFGSLSEKGGEDPYVEAICLAETVQPGCQGLIFHPFLFGRRTPYYDPYARGIFFNLSFWHTRAHFLRSILEGVGYAMRECLEIIKEVQTDYQVAPLNELRASGGGIKFPFWRQIFADILELPIVITNVQEVGTFGAAMLAGIGIGLYKDPADAVAKCVKIKQITYPYRNNMKVYRKNYCLWKELYVRVKDLYLT